MQRRQRRQLIRFASIIVGLFAVLTGSTVDASEERAKLATLGRAAKDSTAKSDDLGRSRAGTTKATGPATTAATTTRATNISAPPTTMAAPAPTTLPSPTTTPPTTRAMNSSAMPIGDLPGWNQLFADDFTTDAPVGAFESKYASRWSAYPDGWKDSAGKSEGSASRYFPSRVLSVRNGVLNKHLHTENGTTMVAAVGPKIGAQLYGRYAVRFRADEVAGFKTAWLFWPKSGIWPAEGEIDFPEGDLNGSVWAFAHHRGATNGKDQDAFATSARFGTWHTAVIEWLPGRITFALDGEVIGESTTKVPNTPMHWILQTETCIGHCQPAATASAKVQIDWVVAYTAAG